MILKPLLILLVTLAAVLAATRAGAQGEQRIRLEYTDELEVVYEDGKYVTYGNGNCDFATETGHVYCDSVVYLEKEYARLRGNVIVDDEAYKLTADSVYYNIPTGEITALGSHVELWSYADSLHGAGVHAYYDRFAERFRMLHRPVIYLNYPDSSRMVEIISDEVVFDETQRLAEAAGNVIITSRDLEAVSDCAVMDMNANVLDLFDNPVARRGQSEISGDLISIAFAGDFLHRIDVIDSATGEFVEAIDSTETDFDRSILSGRRIIMIFSNDELDYVRCYDQAYSWYFPSRRGGLEYHENTVSGDTIILAFANSELRSVSVIGGVQGTYLTGQVIDSTLEATSDDTLTEFTDSVAVTPQDTVAGEVMGETLATDSTDVELEPPADSITADTLVADEQADDLRTVERPPLSSLDSVDYSGNFVEYDLADSVITLHEACEIKSGVMSLQAHEVRFDTHERQIQAYAAEVLIDSLTGDSTDIISQLQPATIPVILYDGTDELYGDFLEYSTDTEKGRIVQSKSEYEKGIYYGEKLFREQKHVFYVDDGYYTTCDAEVPHFHFKSSRMKLLEGNKMIARPVVLFIGRMPILAVPYYIFPLKRGRHSGFLPFTFGNFERGDRRVQDVGYYWAASEYWDLRSAVDYHEQNRTLTFKNRVNFNKRYVLNGNINAEYRRRTQYNSRVAQETKPEDWSLAGVYNHTVTPSFEIKAFGSYVSTSTYWTDYSNNLEERLNRSLVSRANFSKRFGRNTSLSGKIEHVVNLDNESRTDQFPTMSLSLPTLFIFGSGTKDEDGKTVLKWYHGFKLRYTPSLRHFSSRVTLDSTSATGEDTLSYRSRKRYATIEHNPSINLPTLRPYKYINIIPRFDYRETWFKIYETDQSLAKGIDASTTYRTYSYNGGVSANTTLYGTVYPNVMGLLGFRHAFTPSIGYTWAPELDRHPGIRSFAGGGASSKKRSLLSVSLKNVFQAKVKSGETEKNLELLSLSSGFSYNFEEEDRPFSNLSTTFQTSTLPRVRISGGMTHSFYRPGTNEVDFFSPYLLNWDLRLSFQLAGSRFLFDDVVSTPPVTDSSALPATPESPVASKAGWNLSVNYSLKESGLHGGRYIRSSRVDFTLRFNLTPNTAITYRQYYDLEQDLTVNNQVNIVRQLHCWTGSLYWVPTGSNRGFGFKLHVTALPDVKLDSGHDTFQSTSLNPLGF